MVASEIRAAMMAAVLYDLRFFGMTSARFSKLNSPRWHGSIAGLVRWLLWAVLRAVVVDTIRPANRLTAEGATGRAAHRILLQLQCAAVDGAYRRVVNHASRLENRRGERRQIGPRL